MDKSKNFGNLTEDEVKIVCKRHFVGNIKQEFEVVNFEFHDIGQAPIGFLGRHQYLEVTLKLYSKGEIFTEKLKFFLKTLPRDVASQAKYMEDFGVFKKEIGIYKNLIPRLEDINIGCGYFAPKCYFTKADILIMENLDDLGFQMATKSDGTLDYDHLDCALKSIAKLHSSSMILELKTNRKIPNMYGECLIENAYPDDQANIRSIVFKKATGVMLEFIKLMPKYNNSDKLQIILEEFPKVLGQIFELVKPSRKFQNVFCHGDLWANNVMFKYGPDSKAPIESRLVDFQLVRYAPPIVDVITILTIPTTSIFRKKHLDNLLRNYYHCMKRQLSRYEIDLEDVITEHEFWESVHHYKIAGLIESCLFSHLTLLPTKVSTNLCGSSNEFEEFLTKGRTELCLKAFKSCSIYRERMTDMISEIIDDYILV